MQIVPPNDRSPKFYDRATSTIHDVDSYCESLTHNLQDKLWWLWSLPNQLTPTVFDFGCADGAVLRAAGVYGVGYDPNYAMIQRAIQQHGAIDRMVRYVTNVGAAIKVMRAQVASRPNAPTVLLLSSVLHELPGDPHDHPTVLKVIDELRPDYIAVRDMGIGKNWGDNCIEWLNHLFHRIWADDSSSDERAEHYFRVRPAMLHRRFKFKGYVTQAYHEFTPTLIRQQLSLWDIDLGADTTHFTMLLRRKDV